MISAYIKELLKNQNRVIVPDLGAFLKKNENPDQVYFNEFLRFNDGLLVDYIAEKENLDKAESAKKIKNFVTELNNILQNKQSYELKGIGTLSMDAGEKIQLKVDLLNAYEPDTVPVSKNKSKSENKPETAPAPEPPESKVVEFDLTTSQSDKKAPNVSVSESKISQNSDIQQEAQPFQFNNIKTDNPNFFKIPESDSIEYKEEKSGNRNFLWIGILVIVLLLILSWFYIIKPRMKSTTDAVHNDTISTVENKPVLATNAPPKDTARRKPSPKNEIKVTPKAVKTEVNTKNVPKTAFAKPAVKSINSGNNKYFIVVGCFAMESNADDLVRKLASKGFNAEKFTKIKELYFVSIASFPDRVSAQNELGKYQSDGYPDCWIKKN